MKCTFTLHSHYIAALTHYPRQHASLPPPRMERASILPLSTASKDDRLFDANHVWNEVSGMS
jgi:hypothetical protein